MIRYLFTLVNICLLASQVQAADFVVHVPDEYIEQGILWNGFYRHRSGESTTRSDKLTFFVDDCVVASINEKLLDSLAIYFSRGKCSTWAELGVKVEAVGEEIIVHVPDWVLLEGTDRDGYSEDSGLTREQFFLDKMVFHPINKLMLDWLIRGATWGKIKSWNDSEITVEVKK